MRFSFQKLLFIGAVFFNFAFPQFAFSDVFSDRFVDPFAHFSLPNFNSPPSKPETPFESLRNFLAKKVGLDPASFEEPTYYLVKTMEMYSEDFFDRCYLTLDFRKYSENDKNGPKVIEGFRVGLKSDKVELFTQPITRETRINKFNQQIFQSEQKLPDMCETQGCVDGAIIHSQFDSQLVDIKGIISQRWGYDEVGQKKCFFPKPSEF